MGMNLTSNQYLSEWCSVRTILHWILDADAKDFVYINFQSTVNSVFTKDLAIVAGNFNIGISIGDVNTRQICDRC